MPLSAPCGARHRRNARKDECQCERVCQLAFRMSDDHSERSANSPSEGPAVTANGSALSPAPVFLRNRVHCSYGTDPLALAERAPVFLRNGPLCSYGEDTLGLRDWALVFLRHGP